LAVHEPAHQQPLKVYPNPATDVLYLKDIPCETAVYTILNSMGQRVKSGTTNGSISIADLENGIYVLQVDINKKIKTAKFVVK
jgi:hypothetical protein